MNDVAQTGAFAAFLLTAIRLSTPLSFAALGGYLSERAGTINIALEGMMLMGAFMSAVVAHATHSAAIGIIAGVGASFLLAALHGLLCIEFRSNQIISGLAVNLLAAGLPPVVSKALYGMSGGTPLLDAAERVKPWFGVSPLVVGVFFALGLLWFIHRHTSLGQYIRFAGEHPEALASQGINVRLIRWIGVLGCGVLCGLGGAYLSIDHGGGFSRNMTAGRGFIALAALIIGRWHPTGAVLGALIFGAIEAAQILMQGMNLPGGQTVPVQLIQILPYVATLLILAAMTGGRFGSSKAPRALGKPL